jgi:CubicO group peptidase (beta-lactamase class C family)
VVDGCILPAVRLRHHPLLPALVALSLAGVTGAERPQPQGSTSGGADVRTAAALLPQLRSLLVSRGGELVTEYYAKGVRATTPANVKSASKSIISALVGIAIERGLVKGLREPIATWFPELRKDPERRKQAITIEDLLTMRSGLDSTSGRNYGAWVRSSNWVRYVLARPMVSEPGDDMEYSTGTSHLLSAILTKASGVSTWQFAQESLAKPLGFTLARWPQDPQGIYFGGNEMLLTPRQMVSIGELWLRRGAAGGRQIVPAEWVDASCVPRTTSAWDSTRRYGYGWWIQAFDGGTACFAWGYGGQYIMVFRDLALVVVATSSTAVSEERRGHRRDLFTLIEDQVLKPLRADSPGLAASVRGAR